MTAALAIVHGSYSRSAIALPLAVPKS